MNKCVVLVVFVSLSLVTAWGQSTIAASCLPRTDYQPRIVSNPDNTVTFHCDHATRMDLIRAVGFQTRLPLGVVLGAGGEALTLKMNSYDLDRVDAQAALRQAIAGTGYSLKEEDGVLVMIAGDLTPRQSNLLSHAFFDFKPGERESMAELGFALTMWLGSVVDPQRSYGASILGSTNDEQFTIHVAPGATTEQIANEIVRQGSKGIWVLNLGASSSGVPKDEVRIESYQHYTNAALSRDRL